MEEKMTRQRVLWVVRVVIVIFSAVFISLMCGSTSALNPVITRISLDLSLSPTTTSLLSSSGIIGVFLTFLPGAICDRIGPFPVALVGVFGAITGYLIMSFATPSLYYIAIIGFLIAGFGEGAIFIAMLSCGLKMLTAAPGLGVALVGSSMSISLALTAQLLQQFNAYMEFSPLDNSVWRIQIRFIVVLVSIFQIPLLPLLLLFKDGRKVEKEVEKEQSTGEGLTLLEEEIVEDIKHLQHKALYGNQPLMHHSLGVDSNESEEGEWDGEVASSGWVCSRNLISRYSERFFVRLYEARSMKPAGIVDGIRALYNLFFLGLINGYFWSIGAGMLIITGATQIWDASIAAEDQWVSAFDILTFYSVCNLLSNLSLGIASDLLWKGFRFPRHWLQSLVMILMGVVALGIATMIFFLPSFPPLQIPLGIAMAGMGSVFGAAVTIYPTLASDYYGFMSFGMYFSFLQIGSACATLFVPLAVSFIMPYIHTYAYVFAFFSVALIASALYTCIVPPTPMGHIFRPK